MRFQFIITPEIHFGNGSHNELPRLIERFGSRILLLTGKSSFSELPQRKTILDGIASLKIELFRETITGEPSTERIDFLSDRYRGMGIDCVVAIGGGSVLDAGKALSAMLGVEGSVEQYLEGVGNRQYQGKKVPMIAVSTCSGTGSEVTQNAVISKVGPEGYKRSMRHLSLMPNIAVVDPLLTVGCNSSLTVSSGLDAYTQLLEAYLSTKANPLTDILVLDALKGLPNALKLAFGDGSNLQARSQLAYSAMISGIGLTNAGLGLVHGFASVIGGYFSIPHGVVCATLLPAVMGRTIDKVLEDSGSKSQVMLKLADAGRHFTHEQSKRPEELCRILKESLYGMVEEFQIPGLGNYGVTRADFDKILAITSLKSHPVKFSREELRDMLEERL